MCHRRKFLYWAQRQLGTNSWPDVLKAGVGFTRLKREVGWLQSLRCKQWLTQATRFVASSSAS